MVSLETKSPTDSVPTRSSSHYCGDVRGQDVKSVSPMMAPRLIQSAKSLKVLSRTNRPVVSSKTSHRPRTQRIQNCGRGRPPERAVSQPLEGFPDMTSQSEERPSVASVQPAFSLPGDAAAVSPGMPTATANRVVGEPDGPPPRPKAKARVRMPIAPDASRADASAKEQLFIPRTEPLVALPRSVEDASFPNRKRTILGRYVFGDELKPGEKWKQRLRNAPVSRAKRPKETR